LSNSEEGSTKTDLYGKPIGQQGKIATPRPTDDAYTSTEWDEKASETNYSYSSKYGVARGVASLTELLGWLIVFGSVVLVFIIPSRDLTGVGLFFAVSGMVVVGLSVIMGADIVRATVDNADHTGEMLAIMKADRN
jgi:hypothetical protein